jgi:hypothetical protein
MNKKGLPRRTRFARGFLTQRFGSSQSFLELLLNTLALNCFGAALPPIMGIMGILARSARGCS